MCDARATNEGDFSMNKFVIGASLVLAAFTATPTFAATMHHSRVSASQGYPEAYDANASADLDLTVGGPAVYANGQYAGWDPDPNIRFQLQRDAGAQVGN
jgi:hypothetical protein